MSEQMDLFGALTPLRLAVTGGRGYSDRRLLFATLDTVVAKHGSVEAFMVGDATGADALAWQWAIERGIPEDRRKRYEADWEEAGRLGNRKAAGPTRNRKMICLGKPNVLVAFPGARGTADCVRQAKKAGVYVVQIMETE